MATRDYMVKVVRRRAGEETVTDFVRVQAADDAQAAAEAKMGMKLTVLPGDTFDYREVSGPKERVLDTRIWNLRLTARDRELVEYALRAAPTDSAPEGIDENDLDALADRLDRPPLTVE